MLWNHLELPNQKNLQIVIKIYKIFCTSNFLLEFAFSFNFCCFFTYFKVFFILKLFFLFKNYYFFYTKNKRKKRALSDWLIAPNTKWCGRGHSADRYMHLGGASRADMCCRRHDHCKLNIKGMSASWLYFNFRPFTLSHCSCDKRFV